jgi:D-arabinose 5-phosphate isomerase GutQ
MNASAVAYLIAKGCRVHGIGPAGYAFAETDKPMVQDFYNDGVVCAKSYADVSREVFNTIKQLRTKNKQIRAILSTMPSDAALAVLSGDASETSRTASV